MTSLKTSLKTLTVAALTAAAIVATAAPSQAIPRQLPPGALKVLGNFGGHGITCLVCRLPPRLPLPIWGRPFHGYGNHWGQWNRWHPVVVGIRWSTAARRSQRARLRLRARPRRPRRRRTASPSRTCPTAARCSKMSAPTRARSLRRKI
jgi:hypothetical protein